MEVKPELVATEDEIRYYKCQKLRGKFDEKLQEKVFDEMKTEDPQEIYKFFQTKIKQILKCRKKGAINVNQFNLLLPSNGETNIKLFDTSLLIFVLTEFFNSEHHVLQKIRNWLQHKTPPELDEQQFSDIFDAVEKPLMDLGVPKENLERIKKMRVMDAEAKRLLKIKSFNYNCQPPVANHHHREEVIDNIHAAMLLQHADDTKFGVVVSGLPGCGKSEAAKVYWKTFQKNYYEDAVCWVNCNDYRSMLRSFENIADRCGINIKKPDGSYRKLEEIADLVYRFFSTEQEENIPRKVLFIFDNADDQNNVGKFIPTANYDAIHMLITSQCKVWDPRFRVIKLDVFTVEESQIFLKQNIKRDETESTTKQLYEMFGCHPLGMQQAVSYINEHGINIETYIIEFKKRQKEYMSMESDQIGRATVYTTLSLAYERIENEGDSAIIQLINIIAYLDGRDIKKGLLLKCVNDDVSTLNDILHFLSKYSIINIPLSDSNISYAEQQLTCHSLTQAFLKIHQIDKREEIIQRVGAVFIEDLKRCRNETLKMDGYFWYQHFHHICNSGQDNALLMEFKEDQLLLIDLFKTNGDIQRLQFFIEQILKNLLEKHDDDHLLVLQTQHNIAFCLQQTGKTKEALQIYRQVEQKKLTTLGSDHPDVLITQHNIAHCLHKTGQTNEALEIFRQVEKKQMTTLGSDDPDVLMTQHNIAKCLQVTGKTKEALEIYRRVEQKKLTTLGSDHPYVLTTQNNIAQCLQQTGHTKEALEIYRRVEQKWLTTLGSDHPDVLTTQHDRYNKKKEALEIYRRVEQKWLTTLGSDHPDVLTTQHDIAQCLQQTGHTKEALEIYRRVEQKRLTTLGSDHPDVLTTQHDIAQCLQETGQTKEALEIFRQVEQKELTTLSNDHPSVLITQHNIAKCLQVTGKTKEALEIFRQVEQKELITLGSDHPDVLTTQHDIAQCLQETGQTKEALEIFRQVEQKELTTLSTDHPSVLITQPNIAKCLQVTGKTKEALEIYRRVEKKQLTTFGSDHQSVLTTQHNIAQCLQETGQTKEALEIFRQVEQKELTTLSTDHPSVLITQHNIAKCLQVTGKTKEALEIYRRVEKKQLTTFGSDHQSVLTTQHNIAQCLQETGQTKEALEIFDEHRSMTTVIILC
ncbi:uncharacterized protein [Clytia hemisphaerica]|uniref:uncharacterized protein n=1 Tax=Clytia hemisphaerica TaxID=252671 RepID=UPI0034D79DA3